MGDEMNAEQKLIAKLQRSKERQGRHLLGLIEANDRKQHEIARLEGSLLAIYDMAEKPEVVRQIVERVIGRALKDMLDRRANR